MGCRFVGQIAADQTVLGRAEADQNQAEAQSSAVQGHQKLRGQEVGQTLQLRDLWVQMTGPVQVQTLSLEPYHPCPCHHSYQNRGLSREAARSLVHQSLDLLLALADTSLVRDQGRNLDR